MTKQLQEIVEGEAENNADGESPRKGGFIDGATFMYDELMKDVEGLVAALEYYSKMRFNQELGVWMPGNPDKALNAIAKFRAKHGESV